MNVTCDKCNKRYAIADEKVRGKSMVKIRCKQCQNLIAVQGLPALENPGAPPAAAPGQSAAAAPQAARAPQPQPASQPQPLPAALGDEPDEQTRAMPALDMSQSWFAMVNKQQAGPFTVRQLEGKVKTGEVTLRTYLWKQGMEGWKRASDIPELSPLLAGVSVGATATGPTTSASRPPSQPQRSSAGRDVAVANEMPMPEVTARPAAQAEPSREPQPEPAAEPQAEALPEGARDFDARTDPAQAKTEGEQPAQGGAGLHGLFDGVDAPSGEHPQSAEPGAGEGPTPEAAQGEARSSDPFAALGPVEAKDLPPPGEATKFFIAQAGVNRRNPWWKIALFVGGGPAVVLGVLFLLSQLRIIPPVTRTTEDGVEVQESFFSAGGVSGLKDMLSGEAKRKKQAAEAKRLQAEAERQKRVAGSGTGRPANEQAERERPDEALLKKNTGTQVSADDLKNLYGDSSKANIGPRIKGEQKAADSTQGGLDDAAAGKVVASSQAAFQGCIEEALKRQPNLKVGKITLTVHVGSSGTVIRTELEPRIHELSDWGKCLRERAKRMVFPAFAGDEETAVQIPLVVGVSVQ